MYGKRKSLFEKFNQIDTDIIDEKLRIDENVTIYLINGLYLKVNKGNFDIDNINELDKSINIVLSSRSKKDLILLSNHGKSYVLPIEKLMGKTQKGKQISNFLRRYPMSCSKYLNNSPLVMCAPFSISSKI